MSLTTIIFQSQTVQNVGSGNANLYQIYLDTDSQNYTLYDYTVDPSLNTPTTNAPDVNLAITYSLNASQGPGAVKNYYFRIKNVVNQSVGQTATLYGYANPSPGHLAITSPPSYEAPPGSGSGIIIQNDICIGNLSAAPIVVSYNINSSNLFQTSFGTEQARLTLQSGQYVSLTITDNTTGAGTFGTISNAPCCIHRESVVTTNTGPKKIYQLKSGSDIKLLDLHGKYIDLLYNIVFIPSENYIRIKKSSFGENIPDEDLLITAGHPIWLNNREVQPQDLIDGKNIFFDSEIKSDLDLTYSLCTKDRTFVIINNIPVCTWSHEDWVSIESNYTYFKL